MVSTITVMTNRDLTINLTAWNLTGSPTATWTMDAPSDTVVIFTLSGLPAGTSYTVYVDEDASATLVANLSGYLDFTYSGSGTHDFLVEQSAMQEMLNMLWPILNIAIIFMVLSAVLGLVIGSTGGKGKGKK